MDEELRRKVAEFGALLRTRREALDWSQDHLGMLVSMAQSGISDLESGTRRPRADTVGRLALALGCTVADLDPERCARSNGPVHRRRLQLPERIARRLQRKATLLRCRPEELVTRALEEFFGPDCTDVDGEGGAP